MKVIHYRDKCIGCNVCFEMMPEHWRLSRRDGKATLVQAVEKKGLHIKIIAADEQDAWQAVEAACPVRVIKVSG